VAPSTLRVAVFAGPSLAFVDRLAVDGIFYLPPAARGDVANAARDHDVVLLIDGVFHHDLAPSPKECFEALLHARMFGASSMGALRAAECAQYGFTPLGAIARWYTSEYIDGDDEVAVLTHPQTHVALSIPMVNVRYLARRATREGLLSTEQADNLVLNARRVFYMDRTWDDVLDLAPPEARVRLQELADGSDLKSLDARFALRSVLRTLGLFAA
jgi:TfuA protein